MKILRPFLLALSLAAYASSLPAQTSLSIRQAAPALAITHLTGDLYLYTTYGQAGGAPYPSNTMVLLTSKGAVMFDTPWDSTQYQPLLHKIYIHHHQRSPLFISPHLPTPRTPPSPFPPPPV